MTNTFFASEMTEERFGTALWNLCTVVRTVVPHHRKGDTQRLAAFNLDGVGKPIA